MMRDSKSSMSAGSHGPMDSIAADKPLPSLLFVGGTDEDVNLCVGLLQQALHQEGPDEARYHR